MEVDIAFRQGTAAYAAGHPSSLNPYLVEIPNHLQELQVLAWSLGWTSANMQDTVAALRKARHEASWSHALARRIRSAGGVTPLERFGPEDGPSQRGSEADLGETMSARSARP